MLETREWSFLVPGAGAGERVGAAKAFLHIGGRSLLDRAVTLGRARSDDVVIALPSQEHGSTGDRCVRFVEGGRSRHETVRILVEHARCEWIVIHDIARPFATLALVSAVCEASAESGVALAVAPFDTPSAVVSDGLLAASYPAGAAGACQTPIACRKSLLLDAYERARVENAEVRSTVELLARTGVVIRAVPGERQNFKITYPVDIATAEAIAVSFDPDAPLR